jgi:hypothetical protein
MINESGCCTVAPTSGGHCQPGRSGRLRWASPPGPCHEPTRRSWVITGAAWRRAWCEPHFTGTTSCVCTQHRHQQHVELEPRGGPAPAGQTPKSRAMSMHTRSCPDSEATAATRAVTGSRCAHRLGLSEPESEVGPRPNLRRSPASWLLACAATSQAATSRPLQS